MMIAMGHRSILCVDLDAFFVAVEQARRPWLRGKPVIVGGRKGQRGVVATASYEARRYGVHSALPLVVAERLCPQAIFLPGDFPLYQQASQAFFAILADYTPLLEAASLDEAYLDVTGCEPIVGSPDRAAVEIQRRVEEELRLTCSVGVASNRVVAKVASEVAKPAGLKVVPPGGEAAFLAPLPMRTLPMVGPKVEAALAGMGVRTIGDIANLPQAWLAGRFGVMGSVLWLRANGVDTTPVEGQRAPAKSVGRETTFPQDVSEVALLRATLRLQAERVGAELRRHGQCARCVSLKLRYSDFTTIVRNVTLAVPSDADQVLAEAATALLERALDRDGRAVRLVGVRTSGLLSARQLLLWEAPQARAERLAPWVDRVRDKYGYRYLQTGRTFFCRQLSQLGLR